MAVISNRGRRHLAVLRDCLAVTAGCVCEKERDRQRNREREGEGDLSRAEARVAADCPAIQETVPTAETGSPPTTCFRLC